MGYDQSILHHQIAASEVDLSVWDRGIAYSNPPARAQDHHLLTCHSPDDAPSDARQQKTDQDPAPLAEVKRVRRLTFSEDDLVNAMLSVLHDVGLCVSLVHVMLWRGPG